MKVTISITSNLTKAVNGVCRLSDTLEEWEHPELKRRRGDTEAAVKLECDDANDAYAFRAQGAAEPASAPAPTDAPASTLAPALPAPVYVVFFLREHSVLEGNIGSRSKFIHIFAFISLTCHWIMKKKHGSWIRVEPDAPECPIKKI